MSLQVGQEAPDFTLKTSDMEEVTLSSFRGEKNVVLLFVPFAFTGVCTEELCTTSSNLSAYDDLNAAVFGLSGDSPFSLKNWKEKEAITIPLLSDYNHTVAKSYGAAFDELLGYAGVAKRSAFVIDKEGVVRYAEVLESPKDLPNFDALQAALKEVA
ncbi:MAG: redoxin domain-containing protein [Deltaproteobacteria bacterium]|nr:MAG: redoxin domain-containing protein [Deltaproteobacteria bacterium]